MVKRSASPIDDPKLSAKAVGTTDPAPTVLAKGSSTKRKPTKKPSTKSTENLRQVKNELAACAVDLFRARLDNDRLLLQLHTMTAMNKDISTKYYDLLYAVQDKYPGETRHETAKKLILKGATGTDYTAWEEIMTKVRGQS